MDAPRARDLLDRLPRFEVKPGLDRICRLLDALDHPECRFPAIHVAGTNGKGSVVAMLDAVLRRAGLRVGRYTSPDLVDFRDRIVVDGEWISERALADGVGRLADAVASLEDTPSQFEAITAVAFDHFARERVDVAIVEVGLGGRFDATNVVAPILTILTNVALDHVGFLGDTVEKIAWEKAGIAKPGVPLVHGALDDEALRVVRAECARADASLIDASDLALEIERCDWDGSVFRLDVPGLPERIDLGLVGAFQAENLRVALRAVDRLRAHGLSIGDDAIEEGLRTASWPGRFEVMRRSPTIVLDGAHNVAGARTLAHEVNRLAGDRHDRRLLLGLLADKDVDGIVAVLAPSFSHLAACASSSPRALPADALAVALKTAAGEHSWPIPCYHSVARAVEEIVLGLSPDDLLVVAGSLTVVAEARRALVGVDGR